MNRIWYLAALFFVTYFFGSLAMADNPEIAFFGTVVARACNIAPQSVDQIVDMDTVVVKTLYRNGHERSWPFFINLTDCKTDVFNTITVTFNGIEDRELTGKLAVNNGANGVAIALFDQNGTAINLGTPTRAHTLLSGNNMLKFSAYVQGRPSAIKNHSITEGSFSSLTNFIISYQ